MKLDGEPDAIVEYLFVEIGYDPEKAVENNDGTFYGTVDIYFTGTHKNDNLLQFRETLIREIQVRAGELIYFQDKLIDLNTCKFGVLDEEENITEFEGFNQPFLETLMAFLKVIIVGKDFDLIKFKTHQIFNQFYKFVYLEDDDLEEAITENYVEPDATVEYLFVEKAEKQLKPINDDQGYIMGFINLFFTGQLKNDDYTSFKNLLEGEINYSLDPEIFKNEVVDLSDYKFALLDNNKNVIEFDVIEAKFYEALKASLRNLLIVGKNFDIEPFKHDEIFHEWFDNYSNRI